MAPKQRQQAEEHKRLYEEFCLLYHENESQLSEQEMIGAFAARYRKSTKVMRSILLNQKRKMHNG